MAVQSVQVAGPGWTPQQAGTRIVSAQLAVRRGSVVSTRQARQSFLNRIQCRFIARLKQAGSNPAGSTRASVDAVGLNSTLGHWQWSSRLIDAEPTGVSDRRSLARWQASLPLHVGSQVHRISSTFAVPGGLHMYDDYEGKTECMPVPLWGEV
ncbi:uncharacterized protein BO80DRAFT_443110 [Aspergillus ibericus CBS 121593]|uniref:Uncharacterized protein n=1 Tax=Aspergillus ibericus CBS 121593 TaxID=1448316 RepID=A0A395H5S2_9EURO|nr:hypothetical protein BO80DRAFT_443110 [Aspergillus ibericus CBS 121593]RAL02859.1 hypothetical protein BO80DRAFT_443110 [Aspergillus ibericus CBS 121593]